MKLTCALLVADLPQSGGRLNHIVAETNVVIDAKDDEGQPIHATSDKTVYDYNVQNGVTNETVTLTGNPQPQVKTYQGTFVSTNWADVDHLGSREQRLPIYQAIYIRATAPFGRKRMRRRR